jgi:hypothetical protein
MEKPPFLKKYIEIERGALDDFFDGMINGFGIGVYHGTSVIL